MKCIFYICLEPAYPVAGCPAVNLYRRIRILGICGEDPRNKSLVIVADGFPDRRQTGTINVF